MRAVLDTDVVVSALIWGGRPFALFHAATEGDLLLHSSPALPAELRDVLGREHLASRLEEQFSSVESAIRLYTELAVVVSPTATPRIVPSDPDDDHVIACALTGQADLIITGDRHLLILGTHQRTRIVTPAEALTLIAGV